MRIRPTAASIAFACLFSLTLLRVSVARAQDATSLDDPSDETGSSPDVAAPPVPDASDDLPEPEGRRHQREYPPRGPRGQPPRRLQAERGKRHERAAEQQAREQWPGRTTHGDARRDAGRFDQAGHSIGRVEPQPAGDLLPEPQRRKGGKPGDQPDHGLENPCAAALAHDGDQESGGDHVAETEQAIGDDDADQRPIGRQRLLAFDGAGGSRRSAADHQGDGAKATQGNRSRPEPARRPAEMARDQHRHHGRGGSDAQSGAAEMQALEVLTPVLCQAGKDDAHMKTMTKALAMPARKRMITNACVVAQKPISPASRALAARLVSISLRSRPCAQPPAAASAPTR